MSDDSDDLTESEMRMGVRIFLALYLIIILLLFVAIGLQLYLGATGYNAMIAIPAWAAVSLILRVMKTSVSNVMEDLKTALDETYPDQEGGISVDSSSLDNLSPESSSSGTAFKFQPKIIIVVTLLMLCVSTFWYIVGGLYTLVTRLFS